MFFPPILRQTIAGLMLCGCGATAPRAAAPSREQPAKSAAERYLPLKDNTVFAYDTVTEPTGEHGVIMLQVRRAHAKLAEISIAGKKQRLEIAANGIRNLTGGYLLKLPLTLGAHWMGQAGEVRVTAVDKSMDVPAGHFVGCLETVEQQATSGGNKKVTTVFCPHVGIVVLDVEGFAGGEYGHEHAVLHSFGQKVDLGAAEGR